MINELNKLVSECPDDAPCDNLMYMLFIAFTNQWIKEMNEKTKLQSLKA